MVDHWPVVCVLRLSAWSVRASSLLSGSLILLLPDIFIRSLLVHPYPGGSGLSRIKIRDRYRRCDNLLAMRTCCAVEPPISTGCPGRWRSPDRYCHILQVPDEFFIFDRTTRQLCQPCPQHGLSVSRVLASSCPEDVVHRIIEHRRFGFLEARFPPVP